MRNPVGKRPRLSLLAGLALALAAAQPAAAHGPSVRITYDGLRPAQILIAAGQTLHFHNGSTTARTFTLVADDGSFESPALPRGEGWHHTFEAAGRFGYHVLEYPDRKGTVIVVPDE
jgi:plastocyanin